VIPEQVGDAVVTALRGLVDEGLVTLPEGAPDEVVVERPRQRDHGDYATNVALQLAKQSGVPPRVLAELLAGRLRATEGVAAVEVAGPGFLNLTLDPDTLSQIALDIVAAGASYGRSDALQGERINLEFISANPTGPLHLGHTRWAAVGDALARVLEAAGAQVGTEFYVNDRGTQMDKFGDSILARALGEDVPEDGYQGDYIADLAQQVVTECPGILDLPEPERRERFREEGYRLQLAQQQAELAEFHTEFDVWFSERTLHDDDSVVDTLEKLRGEGHLYDADGALWMRTTDFGDDKDRVLIRSNGELTYFASDTAYYLDKRSRGFDRCIYLLGADHHGYVGRLRAMAACAGDDPDASIEVLIGQLVKILDGGRELRLSKRAGTLLTLRELIDRIGVDALRYTLARYPADSPLTLDAAEMTRQASENPVYYVQYAHARVCSILRNAADLGIGSRHARSSLAGGSTTEMNSSLAGGSTTEMGSSLAGGSTTEMGLLTHELEGELLRALADFPSVVQAAATLREPHRVARYLEATAAAYHRFYDACRVLPMGDEEPSDLHRARLLLVDATRIVLANGLGLLGVTAPERM